MAAAPSPHLPGHSRLPPELELRIFEFAALSLPKSIPSLVRVAWRVKQWVEPLLYRTLVITYSGGAIEGLPFCTMNELIGIIQTKSPAFLSNAVQNVMLDSVDRTFVRTVLSAFSGIKNLFLNVGTLQGALDVQPLRHLYCALHEVFDPSVNDPFTHRVFSNITHLELFGLPSEIADTDVPFASRVARLPHLTHFSLNRGPGIDCSVCVRVLTACKRLHVLVFLCEREKHAAAERAGLARDVRFVMLDLSDYETDWQWGILTGNDYWARAEAFIAKRISGEIDRNTFFLEGG
ncbi:hypothetical protein GGX14DRAFT_460974 [Mycena pura]|uniref:Uncharacterized protein n=1 Tax=Mycena pura TaxID=153505 RepID=A0AAD6Y9R1_9AGAR|nr:hypothetical protein GGX14DRAFT_460974 [Mycena pura]